MPDPTSTDASREWVELYNFSTESVNITGWKIQSYNGVEEINDTLSVNIDRNKVITTNVVIPAKSYIVLTDEPNNTGIVSSNPAFLTTNTFNLYQSNATIILRNNQDEVVDFLSYASSSSGRSWQVDGPLCKNLIKSSDHTAGLQNTNFNSLCWPSEDPPPSDAIAEEPVMDYIRFSLDNQNWYDQIDVWGPARVYISYAFANYNVADLANLKIKIDDIEISSPFVFTDFSGVVSVSVEQNGNTFIFESLPINVTSIDSSNLISNIEFSVNNTDWFTSGVWQNNSVISYRYTLGYTDLQIDSVELLTHDALSLANPFSLYQYSNTLILKIKVAGIDYLYESSPLFIYPLIHINEYMFNSENDRWIEIFNPYDFSIDLSNFQLVIGTNILPIPQLEAQYCQSFIEPNSYCIVDLNNLNINDILIQEYFKIQFINEDIEQFSILHAPLGQSVSFYEDDYIFENMQVTKNYSNSPHPPPPPPPIKIFITEVYPAPNTSKGEYEWLELYNASLIAVSLDGYYLKDKGSGVDGFGSSKSFLSGKSILPGEHIVINDSELFITLNNSGDFIGLFNPKGELIDFVSYPKARSSESWNRTVNNSAYTQIYTSEIISLVPSTILTPGELNQFPVVNEPVESIDTVGEGNEHILTSIEIARVLPNNSNVFVEGIVTVEKDVLGANVFYIQDTTAGIRIELNSSIAYAPQLGDILRIFGNITESYSERKIRVSSFESISKIAFVDAQYSPLEIKVYEPNWQNLESSEGMLVFVEGEIVSNYSTSMDIETAKGVIRVAILSTTGINISKSKGDYIKAYGILAQYNGVYRVSPRYASDIEVITPPKVITIKSANTTKKTPTNQVSTQNPRILSSSSTQKLPTFPISTQKLESLHIPSLNQTSKKPQFNISIIAAFGLISSLSILLFNNKQAIFNFLFPISKPNLSSKELHSLKKYYD
jgi:uncharacterized protein YdeI (BOF family)